uniref:Reverse transcriptase domain-containing protein n=1 Tax=Tanacetum cinerariifolium TaxID=118510 RepID=A0A699I226_TANCI|nr:hypothetical protein [Tanacetum cinerariifolium]
MNQQREHEALLAAQREQELREQEQAAQEKEEPPQNSDFCQLIGKVCGTKVCEEQKQNMKDTMLELLEEVKNTVEHATKRRTRSLQNFRIIHKKSSISLNNTGDEHFSTISKTESDEVIKSSVKNLVPIPSESEVTSDNESECDVPVNDESSPIFTTFSNPLFDCNDDFTSSDDKSLSNEDVLMIYSNSLFDDEESISTKIDSHYFNAKSNLLESLLNRDTLIDSSPKFDFILEEFSSELAHINPIMLEIEEADFEPEEEIHLVENLFDSQMEEIDLFLATDDLMPPGIKNEDYDSEGDIYFFEELLSDDPLSLPKNESLNFDHHDDLSFPRSLSEPSDVEVFFKPNTGVLTTKMVEDISEHYVLMPKILPFQPSLCPNIDTFLPFSSENEEKVCKHGILSYLLVSHRDKITFDFFERPMMMIAQDLEASGACCFVHRPLELQSLAYGNLISEILLI